LAEHHLALHEQRPGYTGILNHHLSPKRILNQCIPRAQELCELNFGAYPQVEMNGNLDVKFPFIDVHLEYMLFELLKNAFRATVQFASKQFLPLIPPVEVTIAKGAQDVGIRIRDQGGGFAHERLKQMWAYSYSTVDEEDDDAADIGILSAASKLAVIHGTGGPMAGLGYGLPMTRIYAQWSGGSLDLVPMENYGCDVFMRLPHIGDIVPV
jgi:signal transduction histidine kinase